MWSLLAGLQRPIHRAPAHSPVGVTVTHRVLAVALVVPADSNGGSEQ